MGRVARILVLIMVVAGCGAPTPEGDGVERLRVGVLPDRDAEELKTRNEPLMQHLEASIGIEIDLLIPESYDELLAWFDEGRIQIAWFGGLTFVRAEHRSDARALVTRDVDLDFTTDFLVSSSTDGQSMRDLAGATIAFGPVLSTSGHLMPRSHLSRAGFEPQRFFASMRHSSGHDQTALWVQQGQVDVGAVNSVVVESMLRDGRLSADRVRVLESTPPYRNYVWAVQPGLSKQLRDELLSAFLALELGDPAHATILAAQGARGFVPARAEEYEDLRRAAATFGVIGDGG